VLQNVVVALCRVNAREGRISLDDDIHVLAGPGEQLCVSVRLGEVQQWRLIEQDIAVDTESVQRCPALLSRLTESLPSQMSRPRIASVSDTRSPCRRPTSMATWCSGL
jgi:hypothetical protein